MTEQEVQALAGLLNKATLSPAEQLWAQALLERLLAAARAQAAEPRG